MLYVFLKTHNSLCRVQVKIDTTHPQRNQFNGEKRGNDSGSLTKLRFMRKKIGSNNGCCFPSYTSAFLMFRRSLLNSRGIPITCSFWRITFFAALSLTYESKLEISFFFSICCSKKVNSFSRKVNSCSKKG